MDEKIHEVMGYIAKGGGTVKVDFDAGNTIYMSLLTPDEYEVLIERRREEGVY